MGTSIRNNPLAAVGGLLAAGLLGVAEGAPAPCANQEIVLEGKPLEMDYRNSNAVLRDVVITQCSVRIQAAEADIKGGLNFENNHRLRYCERHGELQYQRLSVLWSQ